MEHCLDSSTCHFRRWSCRRRFPASHFGFIRGYSSTWIEKRTCFLLRLSCPDLLHTRPWFAFLWLLASIKRDQPFTTKHPCGCSWLALQRILPHLSSIVAGIVFLSHVKKTTTIKTKEGKEEPTRLVQHSSWNQKVHLRTCQTAAKEKTIIILLFSNFLLSHWTLRGSFFHEPSTLVQHLMLMSSMSPVRFH